MQFNFSHFIKKFAIAFLALFIFLSFAKTTLAVAGINRVINFQGKLVNKTTGVNVSNGSYSFTFKIYDHPTGGTQLWSETQSLTVTDGIFRAGLGSVTPIPSTFNFNWDGLYLDITFNGEQFTSSRVQLTAVPYAFNAGQVAGLTVQDSTSGAASTSAILKLGDATTQKTFDLGANNLTFSTSGTTTLTLPTSGTVTALGNTTTGTGSTLVLASNPSLAGLTLSSGAITLGGVTGSGLCITGGATAAWGSCGGGGINYWTEVSGNGVANGGYITPFNSTADFFLGGQATSSAKFAILNLNLARGNQIASIAGSLVVGQGSQIKSEYGPLNLAYKSGANTWTTGLSLNEDGTVSLANALGSQYGGTGVNNGGRTLTINTNSGTIAFGGASKTLTVNENLTLSGATGKTLTLTNGLTVNGGSDGTLAFGAASKTLTVNNSIGISGTDGSTLNVGAGGTLGTGAFATIANYATLASPTFTGTVTIPTPFTLGATSVTTTGTQLNYLNAATGTTGTTSTNVVFSTSPTLTTPTFNTGITLGSGATITIGGSTSDSSHCIVGGASGVAWGTCGGASLFTQGTGFAYLTTTTDDLVLGGSSAAAGSFFFDVSAGALYLGTNQSINGSLTLYSSGVGITDPTISADASGNLNLAANQNGASVVVGSGTGDVVIDPGASKVGLGITSSIISQLHVTRALTNGALGKSLAIFDQIENQDLLTASKSGTAKFRLDSSGNIQLASGASLDTGSGAYNLAAGALGIGNSNATSITIGNSGTTSGLTFNVDTAAHFTFQKEGSVYQCSGTDKLTLDSSGHLICSTDSTGSGGASTFNINANGTITALNNTADLLIGGTSTSSANFSFTGLNPGNSPQFTSNGTVLIGNQTDSTTDFARVTNAAGTFVSGGTSAIANATQSATFNGSLYVGTNKAGAAEVYRYNGSSGNWTQLNVTGTAGKFNTTTSIDGVTAMTVWNGNLYIGTTKASGAEVYRYDGGTTWTQVNTSNTAGTFGATTVINGVTAMTVYNGSLYIGTSKANAAQIFRYDGGTTWTVVGGSTAGTVCGTASVDTVSALAVVANTLYAGTTEATKAQLCRYDGGTTFTTVNTAGTVGSTASANGINSMAVYDGALYLGVQKNAAASIYRYDLAIAGGNNLTRVIPADGQVLTTTGIDDIMALQAYNGTLYAGTKKTGAAEIYAYSVGTTWTKASNTTAGQISVSSPPTSTIDAVSFLQVYNGQLVVGTQKASGAEVYTYTNIYGMSYSLKFRGYSANNSQSEQSSLISTGSIYFNAADQARSGNNQGGKFSFSAGITTATGAYDVAEDYPTRDDTLEQGDLVSIDLNEKTFVKKTSIKNDATVIGVYSSDPALRLSQADVTINGGRAVPIALAGRVPIKVSTESGNIKAGDYLTSSSIPGVAMKAVGNVNTIAQAMEGYSGREIGKVMSFIKSGKHQASIAESFANLDTNSLTFGQDVLNSLISNKFPGLDSIVTDRLIAGLEIVTPKLTANEIDVKKLRADQIEGLDVLLKVNLLLAKNAQVASTDSAVLSATDRIASIEAELNSRFATRSAVLALPVTNLNTDGLASVSGNLRVKGNAIVEGILNVVDTLTAQNFIVNNLATFFGDVIFKGNVEFNGTVVFNSDTAGEITIQKGNKSVEVKFSKEYKNTPVIQVSTVLPDMTDDLYKNYVKDNICDNSDSKDDCQTKVQQIALSNNSIVITNKSTKGFTIVLSKEAQIDKTFNWTAISVKKISDITGL